MSSDYHRDMTVALQGDDGMARFQRILWDEEIKVLYFEDHAGSIIEVWLNGDEDRHDDFGVWGNNSLNNGNAEVLWENT
jgi:hypothetical protein